MQAKIHLAKKDNEKGFLYIFTGNKKEPLKVLDIARKQFLKVEMGLLNDKNVFSEEASDKISNYLFTENPQKNIKCLTTKDTTFILNSEKKIEAYKNAPPPGKNLYITVDSWHETTTYITFNDIPLTPSIEPPNRHESTIDQVAACICKALDGAIAKELQDCGDGYFQTYCFTLKAIRKGAVVMVQGYNRKKLQNGRGKITDETTNLMQPIEGEEDGKIVDLTKRNFDCLAKDVHIRKNSFPTFEDLFPASYFPGHFQIRQTAEGAVTGYYVKNKKEGYWEESLSPDSDLITAFDRHTLPLKAYVSEEGSVQVVPFKWAKREVGDEDSVPTPSFANKKINNIFLYKDRLCFLTDSSFLMSRTGNYWNFWGATAMDVLDSDPIDIKLGTKKASKLLEAIPFNKQIVLRTLTAQYVLSYKDILAPKTVSLDMTTVFPTFADATSVSVGSNFYFFSYTPYEGTQIMEYFVQPDTFVEDAADVTKQCPGYLPFRNKEGTFKLLSYPGKDMLFAFTHLEDLPNDFYVYNFFWQGDEKPLSSWNKWVFPKHMRIVDVEVDDSGLLFFLLTPLGFYISKIDFNKEPPTYLDFYKKIYPKYTYITEKNKTIFNLTFSGVINENLENSTLSFVDDTGRKRTFNKSNGLKKEGEYLVSIPGKYKNVTQIYCGYASPASIKLTPWYLKNQNNLPINKQILLKKIIISASEDSSYTLKSSSGTELSLSKNLINKQVKDVSFTVLSADASSEDILISSYGGENLHLNTITYEGYYNERRQTFL